MIQLERVLIDISPLRKHRDFRRLFVGQSVSLFGSMITHVAVPYQLYQLTQSSFLVGLLGSVQLVPLLVFGLLGGAFADAMDRRKLLIVSEMVLAVGSGLLVLNSMMSSPSVIAIFAISGLMAAVNGFHRPALDAMIPRLVDTEDLPATAAIGSFSFNLGAICGPALGGWLIATFGLPATYIIDCLTFAISLVALAGVRAMPPAENASRPGLTSIVEGLKFARTKPELIGTYVVDMVAMTFAMPMALFPAMAEQWGGAKAAGWLYSGMSIGSIVMVMFSGWTSRVRRRGAAVVISAALWGVAIIGLGFAQNLATAVLCLAAAGASDMVSAVFRRTIWNETIPNKLRGRLAGVEMISYMSGPMLGNTRAGWMASVWSNQISIIVGGVTCVVGVLACIPVLPRFWTYVPKSKQN